jgi:hypothetical protein
MNVWKEESDAARQEAVRKIEGEIATRIIDDALKLGYSITVNDGGDEHALELSTDRQTILDHMFSTDSVELYVFEPNTTLNHIAWIQLIYGNDGYDVIADSSSNHKSEELLQGAYELSNKHAEGQ